MLFAASACPQAVRRGVIRFLVLVVDCSLKMNERDMRPHRLDVVLKVKKRRREKDDERARGAGGEGGWERECGRDTAGAGRGRDTKVEKMHARPLRCRTFRSFRKTRRTFRDPECTNTPPHPPSCTLSRMHRWLRPSSTTTSTRTRSHSSPLWSCATAMPRKSVSSPATHATTKTSCSNT